MKARNSIRKNFLLPLWNILKKILIVDWTYKQHLKAFLLYRIVKEELDNDNPFPEGKFPSLMEKLKEYRWLDTEKEGHSNFSKDCKSVFEKYKNCSVRKIICEYCK